MIFQNLDGWQIVRTAVNSEDGELILNISLAKGEDRVDKKINMTSWPIELSGSSCRVLSSRSSLVNALSTFSWTAYRAFLRMFWIEYWSLAFHVIKMQAGAFG